jgi:hypothetical protein
MGAPDNGDRMRLNATVVLVLGLMAILGLVLTFGCKDRTTPDAPAGPSTPSSSRNADPHGPARPPPPAPDATITNAPALAGTTVIHLPPLPDGETRSIVAGDGCFAISAEGDLVRGFAAIPGATTKPVTVRRTRSADGSFQDSSFTVAVTTADWALTAFPELVVRSITQESAPTPGAVAAIAFGGVAQLAQADAAATAPAGLEPMKLADGHGIAFAAGSGQRLGFQPTNDALLLYRWSLMIFRSDAGGGPGGIAEMLCVNDGPQAGGRSGYWMPRIEFDASDRSVVASYRGTRLHQLRSPAGSVATDGRWNVALTYRRHGRLFLRVNGRDCGQASPTDSFSAVRCEGLSESRIGGKTLKAPGWALDGLWIGQSELSERVVEKMEAWALARAAGLPGGAAGAAAFRPVIDAEDFPHRYVFDPGRFAAWKKANPKEKRLAFQGRPVAEVQPDRSAWVRVFCDDFRAPAAISARAIHGSSVGDSTSDLDAGKQIWFAPGTNTAVGGKAICADGNGLPFADAYLHDPAATLLTMRLYCADPGKEGKPNRWRNSQFTSVNGAGLGYSWAGVKGFRIRAKLGKAAPGLFPCPIWFYGLEHLFWRTGERVEFDVIELDRDWDNYGATHVHCGQLKGLFGHSAVDTMKKSSPEEIRSLKLAAGKQVCGINAWDGNFHTWEVWIGDDLTYLNVDGIEVARVDTTPEYLERLFMYIDTSLKDEKGMDETLSYDLVLDQVEAFQPASAVDAAPGAPFTGRPTLAGAAEVGGTVTCSANVAGSGDVWYYWHSGGYPRGFGRSKTYTVLADDRGAEIRCMVRAAGAKDQPEAWTAPLRIP